MSSEKGRVTVSYPDIYLCSAVFLSFHFEWLLPTSRIFSCYVNMLHVFTTNCSLKLEKCTLLAKQPESCVMSKLRWTVQLQVVSFPHTCCNAALLYIILSILWHLDSKRTFPQTSSAVMAFHTHVIRLDK